MSITIINGQPRSGKTMIANALRNMVLNYRQSGDAERGALLIEEGFQGEIKGLLEKIIKGEELKFGAKLEEIPWKPNPEVIVIGSGIGVLDDIETLLPGFKKKFGPIYKVTTEVVK